MRGLSLQAAVESQANQVAELEHQSTHLREAMAALHLEEDHSLQKQRRLVATADEEVWPSTRTACCDLENAGCVLLLCPLWTVRLVVIHVVIHGTSR